jgi:hypothetical protein
VYNGYIDWGIHMSEFKSWSELSHLEQVACEFSDFYKDAHGIRPRWIDTSNWTLEDFDREFEVLADICNDNTASRVAEEAAAVTKLEARIADLITIGAKDRAMAIRWIAEAEDAGSDMEYLCFLVGVPYGYFKD